MSERSAQHATFIVERTYEASPARVYAAWADPTAKARSIGADDPSEGDRFELDFRVGGRELQRGAGPNGRVYTLDAL